MKNNYKLRTALQARISIYAAKVVALVDDGDPQNRIPTILKTLQNLADNVKAMLRAEQDLL